MIHLLCVLPSALPPPLLLSIDGAAELDEPEKLEPLDLLPLLLLLAPELDAVLSTTPELDAEADTSL